MDGAKCTGQNSSIQQGNAVARAAAITLAGCCMLISYLDAGFCTHYRRVPCHKFEPLAMLTAQTSLPCMSPLKHNAIMT